jgi:(p)ppGpp synthase/HD superfamily hydrolase
MSSTDHERHKERMRAWLLGKGYYKAVEALEFAAKYHTGIRKDGITPEFHHQISIAHYLRTLPNIRKQEELLAVAFLHDIMEDYNVTKETIKTKFGDTISDATFLMSREYLGKEKSIADYFSAIAEDPIASLGKGGDRIHNYQTMHSVFTCKKQLAYIDEGEKYILPMLREARNNFPDQELAYENQKYTLKGQIELLKLSIRAKEDLETERNKE